MEAKTDSAQFIGEAAVATAVPIASRKERSEATKLALPPPTVKCSSRAIRVYIDGSTGLQSSIHLVSQVADKTDGDFLAVFAENEEWLKHRLRSRMIASAGFFDKSTVEDLSQQTFVRFWSIRAKFDQSRGSPRAYLFGISKYIFLEWSRKHSRRRCWVKSTDSEEDFELLIAHKHPRRCDTERSAKLDLFVDELNEYLLELKTTKPNTYEVVKSCLLDKQTIAEVAARLKVPEGTVKSRLFRARQLLREALEAWNPSAGGRGTRE